ARVRATDLREAEAARWPTGRAGRAALRRAGGAADAARSRGQPVRRLNAWLDRALEREASTRSAALVRIGLAIIILARFGDAMMLSHKLDRLGALLLLAFWSSAPAMLFGYRSQLATALTALTMIASVAYLGGAL